MSLFSLYYPQDAKVSLLLKELARPGPGNGIKLLFSKGIEGTQAGNHNVAEWDAHYSTERLNLSWSGEQGEDKRSDSNRLY